MTVTVVTERVELGIEMLRAGGLVAFPTETVYGLGADAASGPASARVFAAKGRPVGHPLIAHLASADHVADWGRLSGAIATRTMALAEAFWPGPLTVIVPRTARASSEAVGGKATIGLRVPDHPVALALLSGFGSAVVAPSANTFGRVSPTTAAHVLDDLDGLVDIVLDGGPTTVGIESTIVDLIGPRPALLRPGAITRLQLEDALGEVVVDGRDGPARAPGMLASHYAPDAAVEVVTDRGRLAAKIAALERAGELDDTVGVMAPAVVDHQPSWRLPADAAGYAARLYETLRDADRLGVERLLAVPPPKGPLRPAVLDRLTKAAAR